MCGAEVFTGTWYVYISLFCLQIGVINLTYDGNIPEVSNDGIRTDTYQMDAKLSDELAYMIVPSLKVE